MKFQGFLFYLSQAQRSYKKVLRSNKRLQEPILMRMRTCGLLYHMEAGDSSVYYIYTDVNITYVTRVVAECVMTNQSRCLEPEV